MVRSIVGLIAGLVMTSGVQAASLADLSNADTSKGLKEALSQSAGAAVAKLGKENGFLGDPRVKIPLPESLKKVEGMMRTFGMGKQADELVTRMNRAAEAAVPEAKAILLDAVKKMSVTDAKNIVTGGENAATEYFRNATSGPLRDKFLPIVTKATQKVQLAETYNQYAGKAEKFGLVKGEDAKIEEYVTRKALDGLYLMMAEEEKAIRQDPAGRSGYWLKKVFGASQ